MKKNQNKKGFTLVELLVVIAILAILATVSIVGYTSFTKKAKISNDISLTTQMNTILQAEEVDGETNSTAYEAVVKLEEGGLDITKLTPTTNDYNYVYDIKQNRMVLLDENQSVVAPSGFTLSNKINLYAFVSSTTEMDHFEGYSYYLKPGFAAKNSGLTTQKADITNGSLVISGNAASIDVGSNKNINIEYTAPITDDVVIRTQGDQTVVSIKPTSGSEAGTVTLKGFAKTVAVDTTNATTAPKVEVSGSCSTLAVTKGEVEVTETAIVFAVVVEKKDASTATEAKISNSGYIAEVKTVTQMPSEATKIDVEEATTVDNASIAGITNTSSGSTNGNYQISTLAQLESFRDTVNAGATFAGKIVELTADITLKDGWQPIGEGTRAVAKDNKEVSGTFFKGTFDGKNHTISNLNNKGFVPTSNRVTENDGYAYGLFALVDGATIKNLKLTNVDIDQSRYSGSPIDSAAGLIGFAYNSVTVSDITVSGSVKGKDAVAGIIGRWYNNSASNGSVSNCVNNASITASGDKASGIIGFTQLTEHTGSKPSLSISISSCTNNGNVTSQNYVDSLVLAAKEVTIIVSSYNNTKALTTKSKAYETAGVDVKNNFSK